MELMKSEMHQNLKDTSEQNVKKGKKQKNKQRSPDIKATDSNRIKIF